MNCTQLVETKYIPTATEALTASGTLGVVLFSVGGFVAFAMLGIFLEESLYLHRHWPLKIYCYAIGCLSVFPIVGLSLFLSLVVPRAGRVLGTVVKLYLPLPMVLFFKLVITYLDGEEKATEKLSGSHIPLQGPPLCCICCWCPSPLFTRTRLLLIKAAIYQFLVVPVVLFIADEICMRLNIYSEEEFPLHDVTPYFLSLNALSFFLGVYGLVIFTRMTSGVLCGQYIRTKFITLQLHFILIRFQFFIFDILGQLGTLPCHPPVSPAVSALYIKSAVLLGEGFILSLLARFFFLHPPPEYTPQQEDGS